jgi:hypothetical protein
MQIQVCKVPFACVEAEVLDLEEVNPVFMRPFQAQLACAISIERIEIVVRVTRARGTLRTEDLSVICICLNADYTSDINLGVDPELRRLVPHELCEARTVTG